jgi:hypothetical protein
VKALQELEKRTGKGLDFEKSFQFVARHPAEIA